MDDGRHVGGLE